MNWYAFQIGAAAFFFGLLIGSLLTLTTLRKLVNLPLQKVYRALNQISLYKMNLRGAHEEKSTRIKELTEKYDRLHGNHRTDIINQYKTYLTDLNQILEDHGIGGVTPSKKL